MKKLVRSVVVPLALVAAVAACDKGKGGGGGASGPTGAAGAAAIAPAKGGLQKALAAMPADSELILGIDFNKLRSSALYKKYEPMLMARIGDDLKEFQATCGFNPIEKAGGLIMGGKGQQMSTASMFVRGFDQPSAVECLKKHEAAQKAAGKAAQLTVDGNYIEFVDDDPSDATRALWIDDQTAMLKRENDQNVGKDALIAAAAAKDGDGLTGSKAFTDLLGRTHTGAGIWFVVKGDAPMLAMARMIKFKAVYGSIDIGSGIAAEIRMWMPSADEAKTAAADLGKQLGQVKAVTSALSDVSVKADAEDVVIRIKLSQGQIDELQTLLKGLGGGMF